MRDKWLSPPERVITKENVGLHAPEGWDEYTKAVPTRAIRVSGPFHVQTSESPDAVPFFCEDGWLAIDARGYPYAIADSEFQLIYVPTVEATTRKDLTNAAFEALKTIAQDNEAENEERLNAANTLLSHLRDSDPRRNLAGNPLGFLLRA